MWTSKLRRGTCPPGTSSRTGIATTTPTSAGTSAPSYLDLGHGIWELDSSERDDRLRLELRDCSIDEFDCLFGRAFVRAGLGLNDLESLPPVPRDQIERLPNPLLRDRKLLPFDPHLKHTRALIARVEQAAGGAFLLAFQSAEIKDDTHGYAEFLLDEGGNVLQRAFYSYDVAGIEFLTPKVLIAFWLVAGVILMTATVGARWGLRALQGNQEPRSGGPKGSRQ